MILHNFVKSNFFGAILWKILFFLMCSHPQVIYYSYINKDLITALVLYAAFHRKYMSQKWMISKLIITLVLCAAFHHNNMRQKWILGEIQPLFYTFNFSFFFFGKIVFLSVNLYIHKKRETRFPQESEILPASSSGMMNNES